MSTGHSKYSLLGRLNFEDLYNAFLNLDQRRQILAVAGVVVVVILIIVLPISCASSRLSKLEAEVDRGKKNSESLMAKIATYQSAKGELDSIRQKLGGGQGGSLTATLESLANEVGIGENVERLKPIKLGSGDFFDEEGVDATISKVTLSQMTDLLHKIDAHTALPMRVKKLQVKPRYGSRDDLTVTMQISTFRIKKGEEGE